MAQVGGKTHCPQDGVEIEPATGVIVERVGPGLNQELGKRVVAVAGKTITEIDQRIPRQATLEIKETGEALVLIDQNIVQFHISPN